MARSTYVYVVISNDNGLPVAGFTVKHEMKTWLERNLGDYTIWRLADGLRHDRAPVNMTDDL
jgi:hypothetical protein